MMKCGKQLDVSHLTKEAAHAQKDKLNAVRCRSGTTPAIALSFVVKMMKSYVTLMIGILKPKAAHPLRGWVSLQGWRGEMRCHARNQLRRLLH